MKNEKKINDISAHLQTMLVSSLLPLNQILCKQKKYVKKKTDVAVIPERQKKTSLLIEPCGNDGE